jgi:integrase
MPQVEAEQLCLFDLGPDMAQIRRSAALMKRSIRATSTLDSYDSDWRGFERWCAGAGRIAMPATSETLALYVAARIDGGLRVSSLERHVAAVAYQHKLAGQAVPDRVEAREIMNGARRQRKENPRQRVALTPTAMRAICRRLVKRDTAAAARDRALLTLGFSTGLRRSNLVALNLADIRFVPRKGVAVTVRSTKTDQQGRGQIIGVFRGVREETCPVRALRTWLDFRGPEDGPLFTGMTTNGPAMRRLNAETVSTIVKAAVEGIGLDPSRFGGHSLRAGFVTAAHAEGAGTLSIMERTGHKTVDMVKRYLRNSDPFAGSNPLGRAL